VTDGLSMILISGACLGAWAVLSVLGSERQRLLNDMEARRSHSPCGVAHTARPAPAPKPSPKPRGAEKKEAPKASRSAAKRPPAAANAR
jgi:hypothetical protein